MALTRRGLLTSGAAAALSVAMPNMGEASRGLRFNDFTVLEGDKKAERAAVTAARMSANNNNSMLIRVHPQFVSSESAKAQVTDFILALTDSLGASSYPIEGVVLLEDAALTTPFKFHPYYNGYIHPHVREGVGYSDDMSVNVENISNGLRLSYLAQEDQLQNTAG